MFGLTTVASWLLIWRVQRRLLAVILMGAWFAAIVYTTDLLSPWFPLKIGAGVLVIVCALAFFPSRRPSSTN